MKNKNRNNNNNIKKIKIERPDSISLPRSNNFSENIIHNKNNFQSRNILKDTNNSINNHQINSNKKFEQHNILNNKLGNFNRTKLENTELNSKEDLFNNIKGYHNLEEDRNNVNKNEKENKESFIKFSSKKKNIENKVEEKNKKSKLLILFSIIKNIFLFIKTKPILTIVLILGVILLSNLNLINQTVLLKSIDNLQANIAEIKQDQLIYNEKDKKHLEELRLEIKKIEESNKKYNELTNLEITEKTELLKSKITKLSLVTLDK